MLLLREVFIIHHSLTNNQLIQFLRTHAEDSIAFNNTVLGNGRSLCLVKVLSFKTEVFEYQGKKDPKIYLMGINFSLDNPQVKFKNYKLKDCKWAGLVLQGYSSSFNKVYACIGLATQFNGKEYPQLIGLHTSPEAPFSNTYPDEG